MLKRQKEQRYANGHPRLDPHAEFAQPVDHPLLVDKPAQHHD